MFRPSDEAFEDFYRAASDGDDERVTALLRMHGVGLLEMRNDISWTAVIAAAQNRREVALRTMLLWGADPNIADDNGQTALMHAAKYGSYTVLRDLLAFGAAMDLQDKNGDTALILAAREGSFFTVRPLVTQYANPHKRNHEGFTALDVARNTCDAETIAMLEEHVRQTPIPATTRPVTAIKPIFKRKTP